jgi:hypothetical protein
MAKLKPVLGYTMAALSILIMLVGVGAFRLGGEAFISATGLKHSANWTGGEVTQTLGHGTYQTEIHRPVFDALIGEHNKGFIQVAWRPADATTTPSEVTDSMEIPKLVGPIEIPASPAESMRRPKPPAKALLSTRGAPPVPPKLPVICSGLLLPVQVWPRWR